MYRDTISESRPANLNAKEFLAFEELIYEQLNKPTPPKENESLSLKVEPPPPDLDDKLFTDLCDRIKELESWREGVDPGQLHSQFPITNIIALQNRVDSIKDHITDLSATVTQHKAEQDNLDKIASPRNDKLISRLAGVEDRLNTLTETVRPIKEEYDRFSFHDNTNVYARLDSMDTCIRALSDKVAQHKSELYNMHEVINANVQVRLGSVERRLTDLTEALDLDSKAKFSRLEDIEERITYIVERITTLEHNT